MIGVVDYVFYKIYRILIRLKKDESGAKYSALLYVGFYMTIFLILIMCVTGLLYDNVFSSKVKDSSYVVIGILFTILLGWRYYRHINIQGIEDRLNAMSRLQRKLSNILVYFILIALPVATFVLYRFYVFGHI
jgi:cytochrome b561